VRPVASVTFPSGAGLDLGDSSNICLGCHQGRAAKTTVDDAIAAGAGPYYFVDPHFSPVAAVYFGNEAHGGYEYPGKVYAGRKAFANHLGRFGTCVECHQASRTLRTTPEQSDHSVRTPNRSDCVDCHGQDVSQPVPGADPELFNFRAIRPGSTPNYDGDSNTSESVRNELKGLEAALIARIRAYGFAIARPVVYQGSVSPFFFNDSNGNALVDPGEAIYPNRYRFDATLLKAAYNFHLSRSTPSAYTHNSLYIAQLLVDSIEALGGNVAPYTWR
jgi:mono/diheme cytochrome c family protein